ncbi:hypothetical protein EDD11_007712 [Mortierella claussenii]|nr:hypothetical protein EDD11_007712 [Mortierella claussenii]
MIFERSRASMEDKHGATDASSSALTWSIPRPYCARPHLHDRKYLVWIMSLVLLVIVVSAQVDRGVQAYDPLISASEQLNIPVVAGVPPPVPAEAEDREKRKEQAYIQKFETDRLELQGSFYVESTPEDLERADRAREEVAESLDVVRNAKEPLPWEGISDDDDDIVSDLQDDQDAEMDWSFSPWGGEFRYEAQDEHEQDEGDTENEGPDQDNDDEKEEKSSDGQTSQKQNIRLSQPQHYSRPSRTKQQHPKQKAFQAAQADADDGSDVVDEDLSRIELVSTTDEDSDDNDLVVNDQHFEPTAQAGKMFDAEESSRFDADEVHGDPNVKDNTYEVVEPQVWDAVEVIRKNPRINQQYVEIKAGQPTAGQSPLANKTIGENGTTVVAKSDEEFNSEASYPRSKLDQIGLMGHEAHRARNNNHPLSHSRHEGVQDTESEEDRDKGEGANHEYYSVDEDEDRSEDVDEASNGDHRIDTSDIFDDPRWGAEHGDLHPLHHLSKTAAKDFRGKSKSRDESEDHDEDGIVFPDPSSQEPYSKIVFPVKADDPLSPLGYIAYNHQGDRIMDFSMVGWNEGNTDIPNTKNIPVIEHLQPRQEAESDTDQGDDTDRIQEALDRVSQTTDSLLQISDVIPKGALVLERGVYRISKPLNIRKGGILFRGDPAGGSRIVCQWEPTGPRYAIVVEGQKDEMLQDGRVPVVSKYTPVGSFFLALDPSFFQGAGLVVGDQVIVTRIGNDRWIKDIGMDDFDSNKKGVKPWKKMSARMYRTIRSLNPKTGIVQLDAPLPISISRQYGGGFVTKYNDRKIRALGIQYLDMVFPQNIGRTTDDMLDEKGRGSTDYRFSYEIFANYALRVDNAYQMYITHITSAYFHNFISVGTDVHHLTLDSIVHSYPEDMLSGQSAFQLSGQLVLIRNSLSQGSFHFFVDISHVMGPNVFHRSHTTNVGKAHQPMPLDFAPGDVGPHMKLCTGILIDQVVTDGSIQIVNRGDMGTGQGYSGVNSVIWNSRAREGILTHRAKGTQNFVIGSEVLEARDRLPGDLHGWKEHLESEVLPGSLYLRQLSDRLNRLAKGWLV